MKVGVARGRSHLGTLRGKPEPLGESFAVVRARGRLVLRRLALWLYAAVP